MLLPWISLMLLLLFVSLANAVKISGFSLMSVGVALNLVEIVLNRGMPVGLEAVRALTNSPSSPGFTGDKLHLLATASTKFLLLADVLPLPGLSGLRTVLSVGDVLMLVGVAVIILSAPEGRRPYQAA